MEELKRAAEQLLVNNVRRGYRREDSNYPSLREYVYVCPSPSIYPHQWLWDSCFHAIVMARFNPELAKAELETIVSLVRSDGFIPHLTNWSNPIAFAGLGRALQWLGDKLHHTNLTQPPVLAIAVEEIYRHTEDRAFLKRVLPATKSHYQYLATHRDPDRDGLVSIIAPIESGMDHSPAYDAILGLNKVSAIGFHIANINLAVRYALAGWNTARILDSDLFSVEDLAFNCIYAAGLRSVARLCEQVGDDEAAHFSTMADATESAIITRCRDHQENIFYSLYSKNEQKARVKTVASLMPLILETIPSEIVAALVSEYLQHEDFFWTRYPVPSVSVNEEQFCPASNCLHHPEGFWGGLQHLINKYQMVWRGPTWVNTNWFLARGLRLHGFDDIAEDLTARTSQMVLKSGFWEFYNPITGQGMGAPNFGWSTLVVDMMDMVESAKGGLRLARV